MNSTKRCNTCNQDKPVNEFSSRRWGIESAKNCKSCIEKETAQKSQIQSQGFQSSPTQKTCTQCGETKSINVLNKNQNIKFRSCGFYVDSDVLASKPFDYFNYPYRSICKTCFDSNNPSKPGLKKCTTCGLQKPFDGFIKDKTNTDGLRNDCRVCHNRGTKKNQYIGRPTMMANTKDPISIRLRAQLNRVIGKLSRKDVGLFNQDGVCHEGVDYSIADFLKKFPSLDDKHLDHIFPIHFINFNDDLNDDDEIKISIFINSLDNFRLLPASSTETELGNLNRTYLDDPKDRVTILETYQVLKSKYPYMDKYIKSDYLTKLQQA